MNMKSSNKVLLGFLITLFSVASCAQVPSDEVQIKNALLSAPEDLKDNATVYGFDSKGNMITLRIGTNKLICITDDPNQDAFNSACYHKDLEPFMVRGRELRAEGMGRKDIFDTREKEVQAGTLKMPDNPTTLHIYSGAQEIIDVETGLADNGNYRAVVYIPYATGESTGLPIRPEVVGGPWLMDPGTHRAHIMITPPKKDN